MPYDEAPASFYKMMIVKMRNAKTWEPNSAVSPPDCIDGDSLATHHTLPPADAPPLVPPRQDVLGCQVNGSGKRSSFEIPPESYSKKTLLYSNSQRLGRNSSRSW